MLGAFDDHDSAVEAALFVKTFTDGDTKADMMIHLQGPVDLTASDFGL